MQTLVPWLASDGWFRLVQTLGHSLWQGGIIACLLWLALRRLPARQVEARYAVTLGALAALVLCALITGTTLETRSQMAVRQASAKPVLSVESPKTAASAALDTAGGQAIATTEVLPKSTSLPMSNSLATSAIPARDFSTPAWVPWIALGWLAGCGLMTLRFLRQWLGARWLVARCRVVEDAQLLALVARLRDVLGLRQAVRVLCGEHISGPCVFGLLTPKLLLPPALLLGVPVEQLEAILAHELAHIRRRDIWVSLAQQVVEIAFFFNPAMWWISRQLRIEREAGCDSLAVAATGKRDDYARALEAWARQQASSALAPAFSDGPHPAGPLERLKRLLLAGYQPPVRLPWPSLCGTALLAALLILGVFQGTRLASTLAAEILTPAQRIEKLAEIKEKYGAMKPVASEPAPEFTVTVSGRMQLEDGSAPRSAYVLLYSVGPHGVKCFSGQVKKGEFSVSVKPGEIYVDADAFEYAPVFLGPVEHKAGSKWADLKLICNAGYSARILATDESGKPVTNAVIEYGYMRHGRVVFGKKLTNGVDGIAVFERMASNAVYMKLTAPGYEYDERELPYLDPNTPFVWKLAAAKPTQGTVVDAQNGTPVAGAKIKLSYKWGKFRDQYYEELEYAPVIAESDKDGKFQLTSFNHAMKYVLAVEAAGYAPLQLRDVLAGQNLQAALKPQIDVNGKVMGEPGTFGGISSLARVEWVESTNYHCSRSMTQEAPVQWRDGVGYFTFTNIYPGPVEMFFGKKYTNLVITQATDALVIDFRKPQEKSSVTPVAPAVPETKPNSTREVVLKVKVPKGSPPASGDFTYFGRPPGQTVIITNGEAHFTMPAPGGFAIRSYSVPGYWFEEPLHFSVPAGNQTLPLEIKANPAGGIYGKVLEADGSEVDGVYVSVTVVEQSPQQRFSSSRMEVQNQSQRGNGPTRFSALSLPLGGKYMIMARKGYLYAASKPVVLTEAQPLCELTLQLAPGVRLAGQVLDENGQPVSRADVMLNYCHLGEGYGCGNGGANHAGRFSFERVNPDMPGYYYISFGVEEGYQPVAQVIDFKNPQMVIRLRKGFTLEGTVLNQADGKPMPQAKIYASLKAGTNEVPLSIIATANDQGQFTFNTLDRREYQLRVEGAESKDITVIGGQDKPVVLRAKPYR